MCKAKLTGRRKQQLSPIRVERFVRAQLHCYSSSERIARTVHFPSACLSLMTLAPSLSKSDTTSSITSSGTSFKTRPISNADSSYKPKSDTARRRASEKSSFPRKNVIDSESSPFDLSQSFNLLSLRLFMTPSGFQKFRSVSVSLVPPA